MNEMRALIILDPEKAKKQILGVFEKCDAHFGNTAKELGVTYRTLYRWVETLNVTSVIEKIRKKKADVIAEMRRENGALGGRPPKAKKAATKKVAKKGSKKRAKRAA